MTSPTNGRSEPTGSGGGPARAPPWWGRNRCTPPQRGASAPHMEGNGIPGGLWEAAPICGTARERCRGSPSHGDGPLVTRHRCARQDLNLRKPGSGGLCSIRAELRAQGQGIPPNRCTDSIARRVPAVKALPTTRGTTPPSSWRHVLRGGSPVRRASLVAPGDAPLPIPCQPTGPKAPPPPAGRETAPRIALTAPGPHRPAPARGPGNSASAARARGFQGSRPDRTRRNWTRAAGRTTHGTGRRGSTAQ